MHQVRAQACRPAYRTRVTRCTAAPMLDRCIADGQLRNVPRRCRSRGAARRTRRELQQGFPDLRRHGRTQCDVFAYHIASERRVVCDERWGGRLANRREQLRRPGVSTTKQQTPAALARCRRLPAAGAVFACCGCLAGRNGTLARLRHRQLEFAQRAPAQLLARHRPDPRRISMVRDLGRPGALQRAGIQRDRPQHAPGAAR